MPTPTTTIFEAARPLVLISRRFGGDTRVSTLKTKKLNFLIDPNRNEDAQPGGTDTGGSRNPGNPNEGTCTSTKSGVITLFDGKLDDWLKRTRLA